MKDLTQQELQRGLEASRGFTGYFTLPTFREMCKSVDEYPDPHAAYVEACCKATPKDRQKWSHPVVYHAGVATGWYELHAFTEKQIYPAFKRHYEEMCRRAQSGEDMALPVRQALPEHISKPVTPEEGNAAIKKIRAILEGRS